MSRELLTGNREQRNVLTIVATAILRGKVKPIIHAIHGVVYLLIILQRSSQRLQILTP